MFYISVWGCNLWKLKPISPYHARDVTRICRYPIIGSLFAGKKTSVSRYWCSLGPKFFTQVVIAHTSCAFYMCFYQSCLTFKRINLQLWSLCAWNRVHCSTKSAVQQNTAMALKVKVNISFIQWKRIRYKVYHWQVWQVHTEGCFLDTCTWNILDINEVFNVKTCLYHVSNSCESLRSRRFC